MIAPATPLRDRMPVDVDQATVQRMWQEIAARRRRRERAPARLALTGAFAVGVVTALLLVTLAGRLRRPPPELRPAQEIGALKLEGGASWSDVEAPVDRARILDFDDGSRISLAPRARVSSLENTGRMVVIALGAGRAVFDVRPGGPRRWSIEAGVATIDVIGTRFTVNRGSTQVSVEVERGTVLVRGERVVDRVQRLGAGERLLVGAAPPSEDPAASATPKNSREASSERTKSAADAASWKELAERGDYARAYRNLGAEGLAARAKTADLEQLLGLADVARLSGHPADAIEPLRRIVGEYRKDARSALAAFTLGRVHLDSLKDPLAAAGDFDAAISLGLPQALLEDAYLRLIEARAMAGERRAADEVCRAYRQRFPVSTRRATATEWGCPP